MQQTLNYEPGQTIIEQGETGKGFYMLKSGSLDVIKDSIKLTTLMHPGTIFGEMGDILDKERTCTVKANSPSKVVHIQAASMEQLVSENPGVALRIMKTLAARLERTTQKLADTARENSVWSFPKEAETGEPPTSL